MDPRTNSKKKKVSKSENFNDDLELIIEKPKTTDKNELYLFSSEVLSLRDIITSTKPNLHTLVVIRQTGITSLNGISVLINLRELWIVECLLKDLSDLRECRKLERVYLYSNNISQVPNMSNSPELKIFSLSGNRISHLQNFDSMPELQELYISNNRIKEIGDAFCKNSYLSLINLAGNPLYELMDIKNLSFISSLRSIILADPMHGECPLVSLCNYRHFIINYMSNLRELDYYPISNEERSYVTGVFKSKMMFYSMLCNKCAKDFEKSRKDRLEESRQRISEYRKEIYSAKLEELRILRSKDVGERSKELLLHDMMKQIYYRIDASDVSDKRWLDNARINLQILRRKLSLEVQHCGNIDFVEYLPAAGNKLVKICQDMCNDSLCRTVKEDLGITSVHIHRVTKVMNNEADAFRSSIYRSENHDPRESDSIFKFLVRPVGVVDLQKWPFDIFEEEFFDTNEIITSHCLAAADSDWMKRIASRQRFSSMPPCSSSEHRLAILVQLPVSVPTVRVERSDDYHAKRPNYDIETCQCLSIVKPEQVKPVFAVEYEYIFQNESAEDIPDEKFYINVPATNPLTARPCLNFENLGYFLNLNEPDVHKLRVINLSGQGICTIDSTIALPNLRELYLSFNKLTVLPESAMIKYVRKLDVSFNEIRSFAITACLPLLESFSAEWNLAIEFVKILQMLKLFAPNLTTINLKYNPFVDETEIESMLLLAQNVMPLLRSFNENTIRDSIYAIPVDRHPWIIDILENADLDKSKALRNSMENVISETNKSLTSPLSVVEKEMKIVQYINLSNNHLSHVEFVKESPQLKELYLENNLFLKIFIEKSANQLTKLSLGSNFIMTLDGLTQENLPVLSYLDLSNNLITSLIAMGTFHSLTQFYCSHNNIRKLREIHNLSNWHGLKIIDISKNPIDSISLFNKFIIFHIPRIEYVDGEYVTASDVLEATRAFGGSLDRDTIMSMCNPRNLTHLKELSIVNCMIKKVNLTADLLPNLTSLDLSRNQISTMWGLHTLKNLQVLCLSQNQVETSAPNFRRDLVPSEFLFPSLETLFLDDNGIRSLVDLNLQNIPALKYLYLQRNLLRDANGLQRCVNLETLVMDYNKIQIITEEDFHTDNNIKALLLENNKIKYFSFARRLSKIIKLFLSNNKVAVR